ncbi:MAG: DUF3320 domain-containing protein [Acidimicrobiia bacterium]|nr:DUF3320 domain-containing protein [Acidimicrobiia bacterium]
MGDRVLEQVRQWRDELISLSRRDRVLYFLPTKSATLLVRSPDLTKVLSGFEWANGWGFFTPPDIDEAEDNHDAPLIEVDDSPEGAPDDRPDQAPKPRPDELVTQKDTRRSLESALRNLDRRSKQEFMDKGIWILYLAAGFVEWVDPADERQVRTPILLIPVRLDREGPRDPFRLVATDEDTVLNPALVVRMASDFGIDLPGLPEEDDLGVNAFLESVELAMRDRDWRVTRDLALDVFSFHKEVMYRDLLENEAEISVHDMVRALALGGDADVSLGFAAPTEDQLDDLYPPEESPTILDADATQRVCLAAAKEGHSFVMDGPPGTGKSQTIANLIAESLADGKTVLFVSEKIAALEVVKARLDEAGLGEYLLELHSHKATRKEVAKTLASALKTRPVAKNGMSGGELARLKARRLALTDYAIALNESRLPLGRSLGRVLGRASQLHSFPQIQLPSGVDEQLDEQWMSQILDTAGDLSRSWGPVERADEFVWRGLQPSFADLAGKRRLADALDRCSDALGDLRRATDFVSSELAMGAVATATGSQRLADVVGVLQERVDVPSSWLTRDELDSLLSHVDALETTAQTRAESVGSLAGIVGGQWGSLVPADREMWESANGALADLEFGWSPVDGWVHSDLRNAREFLETSSGQLRRIEEHARAISRAMGLDIRGLTLARAQELVALTELARIEYPPEPNWLDEGGLAAARAAHAELSAAVEEFRKKALNLDGVFTEEVLNLDLGGLKARFDTVHRGVRKLGSSYREDKKALVTATPDGKARKDALARLGDAVEWKRVALELEGTEQQCATDLGEHYYRRTETDFIQLAASIDAAELAINLAGARLDPAAFKATLGLGDKRDVELHRTAEDLRSEVRAWLSYASTLLPLTADVLSSKPVESLSFWSDGAVEPFRVLEEVSERSSRACGRALTFSLLSEALPLRSSIETHDQYFDAFASSNGPEYGGYYHGCTTDWADLRERLKWAQRLRAAAGQPLGQQSVDRLRDAILEPHVIRPAVDEWRLAVNDFRNTFTDERSEELGDEFGASFPDVQQLLVIFTQTTADIDEWAAHENARRRLNELGCAEAVESCITKSLPRDQIEGGLERAVLERWIDLTIESDPRMDKLRAEDRDALVQEFRKLDRKLIRSMAARVIEKCNARKPSTTVGAAGIILREGEKKRRHMPVRELIQRTSDVAQAAKPCFMMSPLSVSQFLTPETRFDLVIFDEASQVKPADAVNCIYRGRQLVVAGDQKQLPPTSFFERVGLDGDDEYQEDQFDEFESVLDLAKAGGMESLPLRWHYRSQHEDLITYSNYSFYDGKLVTFPGAIASDPDLGVAFYKADGVYRRGGARDNPEEAELVVDRVIHHAINHPQLTLGVVAFSEAQASRIEYAVDRRRANHPDLDAFFTTDRLAGFFVKNLENVQGDERDIMIFSVGYGFDEAGKFTLNFGPLNRAGGERRLNVAITRARRRVELVASILPDDIAGNAGSSGVQHLRRYLEFARSGISALAIDVSVTGSDVESPLEDEVLRSVRAMGFDAHPQVGVADYRIDLGIVHPDHPGRYILGIECDGAMYHSSRVARDRDRLRQEVLERLGWRIHRIWGPSWFADRAGQELLLRATIEDSLVNGPRRAGLTRRRVEQVVIESVDLDARPEWAEPYRVAKPRRLGMDLHDPLARRRLEEALEEVVNVESPVHEEVVLRRIREANGVGRAGTRIRDAFNAAVKAGSRNRVVNRDPDGFLWLSGHPLTTVRAPVEGVPATVRAATEIPQTELQMAVCRLVADAKLVDRDELTSSVAKLFGWSRRGTEIAGALDLAVDTLIGNNQLIDAGGDLRVAGAGCPSTD